MQLTRVRIRNYRGLKDVQVDLDTQTVLIGENNSGKTTFLIALQVCLEKLRSQQSSVFDSYDCHLPDATSEPHSADPIEIILTFEEAEPGAWSNDLIQQLAGLLQLDAADRNSLTLRVTSTHQTAGSGEIRPDWAFLNLDGNPLTTQEARRRSSLAVVRNCAPVFYLSALRDAGRHFNERGKFWRTFLLDSGIEGNERTEIEAAIQDLNDLIIGSHSSFGEVRDKLRKVAEVVPSGADDVSIDAIPARIFDLLTRTQVSLSTPGGARIPLGNHGEGTQSLAVLRLFEAYLSTHLQKQQTSFGEPILALEEPEAHLHPSAIRALLRTLDDLPGQKVIATHSGDLLAEVDISNIRRFARTANGIEVFRLQKKTLNDQDLRKFNYHVRRFRGELLFARCWLLCEGETDVTLLSESARLLGHDLEAVGIRCVEFTHIGPAPLVKVANDLGIRWHLLADGDSAGEGYRSSVLDHLDGDAEQNRVSLLPARHVEEFLCKNGYDSIYSDNISDQKKKNLEAQGTWPSPSDPDYWFTIVNRGLGAKKPAVALQVLDQMRRETDAIPPFFNEVLDKAILLAKR